MIRFIFTLLTCISIHLVNAQTETELSIGRWVMGTLAVGEKSHTNTLIIIHPGSGPTDRNGNQKGSANNSLKMLSDSLVARGHSCFRLDKRIIKMMNEKNLKEKDLVFDTLVNDLKEVVAFFIQKYSFKNIVLAGHSEGSLISILAASGNQNVKAVISISGPGRPADVVLSDQIAASAPFIKDTCNVILAMLKKGIKPDTIMPLLNNLFRPSVQNYLISWMKYNPAIELSKLNIPVLIINGDNDLQVAVSEADILNSVNKNSKKVIIEGMNHVLKLCDKTKQGNLATYSNPNLPISVDLVDAVDGFVKKL